MVKNRRKGFNRMANRLKISEMDKVLGYAEEHMASGNFNGAVVVLHAAMKQLVATLAGEDMNNVSDPDITIMTTRDCMVSVGKIKQICADTIGVTVADIESRKRTQDVSLARQCAIYYSPGSKGTRWRNWVRCLIETTVIFPTPVIRLKTYLNVIVRWHPRLTWWERT